MSANKKPSRAHTKDLLGKAIVEAHARLDTCLKWLEESMPKEFFKELEAEKVLFIAQNLTEFEVQRHFSVITFKHSACVLAIEEEGSDYKVLSALSNYGISSYKTFTSKKEVPFSQKRVRLKVAHVYFTRIKPAAPKKRASNKELKALIKGLQKLKSSSKATAAISEVEANHFLSYFFREDVLSIPDPEIKTLFELYQETKKTDLCQRKCFFIEDERCLEVYVAWKNMPKFEFALNIAHLALNHGLELAEYKAFYIDYVGAGNTLLIKMRLKSQTLLTYPNPLWDGFFQGLATIRLFTDKGPLEEVFIDSNLLSGEKGHFLHSVVRFIQQILTHLSASLYSLKNIEEALCRHLDLTLKLCDLFYLKFQPKNCDLSAFQKGREKLSSLIEELDTGHEYTDISHKNIFNQALNFVEFCLKTNFFLLNKNAYSFRMDPGYMERFPFDKTEKFPEIPYGIFFVVSRRMIGFHIRFRDLARGGVRTRITDKIEQMEAERGYAFQECYHLAYTQQKKNKDIPEGGSKGVIFLEPYRNSDDESRIFTKELSSEGYAEDVIEEKLLLRNAARKLDFLYESQRAYINAILSLVNSDEKGTLKEREIVDYWKKPEYIYLGPDENMHNTMIQWIAQRSQSIGYLPGKALISSKPLTGINHKEYGVTSYGVNVYMIEVLKYLGIDPEQDPFTVKISGGPDGDVAGNQICNLAKQFPNTAKLVAVTDASGTIFDPEGLNLNEMLTLFEKSLPIAHFPPEKLHSGSFLLKLSERKKMPPSGFATLCLHKQADKILESWLSSSEKNHLFRTNIHTAKADIFIPAGGRPQTLKAGNIDEFLDESREPTSKAIVEGANLYLTPEARTILEEKGTLIIKDSSANKGGVICSSIEVLLGLILSDKEFLAHKKALMEEVLEHIARLSFDEAVILLTTHEMTKLPMTQISDAISQKMEAFTDTLNAHFEKIDITKELKNLKSPWMQWLNAYCLPLIQNQFKKRLVDCIPDSQKTATIAAFLAAHLVYKRGLEWNPSIVDILPLLASDPDIAH